MPNKIARCMPFFADREVLLSMHAGMVVDDGLNPLGTSIPRSVAHGWCLIALSTGVPCPASP